MAAYARARAAVPLREEAPRPEIALQARFYAGEFGLSWQGEDGEAIEAIHLGAWNREPGPDFVGAKLRIDGREVEGDIELDTEASDWERHGHARNPGFARTGLHVFFRRGRRRFFTRTSEHRAVAQVCLEMPTRPRMNPPGSPARGEANPEAVGRLVNAAARFRLARKREAWLRAEALHGRGEALFQSLATGLGYRHNSIPFLLVAQRVGLGRARGADGEALLFGVAGFLSAPRFDAAASETRGYVRGLWDAWWRLREHEARLLLDTAAWRTAGNRPQNHPHRRMGALAAMSRAFPRLEAALAAHDAHAFQREIAGLDHEFWEWHSNLDGPRSKRPSALVGNQRVADLVANVLAPAAPAARGAQILSATRAGSPSGRVRRAIDWLGVEPKQARELEASAFGQQGLLQVYDDFHPLAAQEVLALEV